MVITKKMISTGLFPNVSVWEFERDIGPMWMVEFSNREFGLGRLNWLVIGGAWVAVTLWAVLAGGVGMLIPMGGIASVLVLVLCAPHWTNWVERSIQLDPVNNTFKVVEWLGNKKSKIKITRDLRGPAGWHGFEIKEHPDAEADRQDRALQDPQIKRGGRLTRAEKSHCLYGYFGARGADRVILVTRAEWPNRHSLTEVQEALLWTMEQIAIAGVRRHAGADAVNGPDIGVRTAGGINPPVGIKPPLD
jgi:hypothetical protein